MITIRGEYLYFGLSTDTKPTGKSTPNGASFVEIDTGKGYLFDETGAEWHELPEGSVHIDPAQGVEF